MHILSLAIKSMLNRRFTLGLTTFTIAISIMLLVGVERLRTEAHDSFANTISGTDLIVGARSGPVQLLLYSVFRIGNPTNNISWQSYQEISSQQLVDWTIPLSLGDSHQGFRVLGTNQDYFKHYHFADKQPLTFADGQPFNETYDTVIGADVARKLQYVLGQQIILSHGTGEVSFKDHDDKPFRVVGILNKTGTPVDRTIHVSLQGIEAIHDDWSHGKHKKDSTPENITAVLVGLKSRIAALKVQRTLNDYQQEPLIAVLPGVALQELWDTMAIAQQALLAISVLVVLVGITGMATIILTTLNERRREMAVLRSVGARPWHIFSLFVGESTVIMLIASLSGMALLYTIQYAARPVIQNMFGLYLKINPPTSYEVALLAIAFFTGILVGLIPAYRAYRYSLADGMTIRI